MHGHAVALLLPHYGRYEIYTYKLVSAPLSFTVLHAWACSCIIDAAVKEKYKIYTYKDLDLSPLIPSMVVSALLSFVVLHTDRLAEVGSQLL